MATVQKPKTPSKPRRTVRLCIAACEVNPYNLILVKVGTQSDEYLVRRIPSDFGDAYTVKKLLPVDDLDGSLAGERYDVNLSDEGSTCDCPGHLRHSHCKHVDALIALRQAGKLEGGAA